MDAAHADHEGPGNTQPIKEPHPEDERDMVTIQQRLHGGYLAAQSGKPLQQPFAVPPPEKKRQLVPQRTGNKGNRDYPG